MVSDVIKVGMADYKVGKNPSKIITLGLGSCVGITFFDKIKKQGGMAHIMLPKSNNPEKKSLKYADIAINEMLKEIKNMGSRASNIEVKIAGGAQMFSFTASDEKKSVGYRNVIAVKAILKDLGFRISADDTGGNIGRTIELELETGKLRVKTIGQGENYI